MPDSIHDGDVIGPPKRELRERCADVHLTARHLTIR
jgi:hypothetical protein